MRSARRSYLQRAAETFERLLANRGAAYLHVHNAKRGCYAARVERVIPA
ncbi:MAG TPA: DUF1203 domain-containing protein [Usitatibacter sp.]|nr:DUF1203 domain-containing protein [Usitatibacter sp.]